jgi:GTP-dependent phosphoenolpyruvate carboxykinase
MKRIALAIFILGLALFSGGAFITTSKAETQRRESAVVEFPETVRLYGVFLRGEYVIVHDEERMARGEPCTYIYRSKNGVEGELITSFHCEHVDRAKVKEFTVRLRGRHTPYDIPEVQELQFAGSTAGHRVPTA